MANALAVWKREWQQFRHDEPGERFRNHRTRMKKRSRWHMAVAVVLGIVLLAAGVVLLFIPGPGIPLIIFGVALLGSHSKRLSTLMDRAEPALRRRAHRTLIHWKRLPAGAKAGVTLGGLMLVAAAGLGAWHFVVAPRL